MTKKKEGPHLPMGRPSKYQPEYCEMLIKHMSEGLSFESFGGVVNCHDDTLRNWCELFPEFLDARKRGLQANKIFWERVGVDGAMGKIPGFNATSWIFNMKNRFKWTDRLESNTNHSGKIDIPAVTFVVESSDDDKKES
jgi:hypothetical protein